MEVSLIDRLLAESPSTGEEEERGTSRVKAYVLFKRRPVGIRDFLESRQGFNISILARLSTGEYEVAINNCHFFVEDSRDLVIAITRAPKTAAQVIEKYVQTSDTLAAPWVRGDRLREAVRQFVGKTGRIIEYSARFVPYRDFTGYAITMKLWGRKSSEIYDGISREYVVAPYSLGGELTSPDSKTPGSLVFRVTTTGRLSLISGRSDLFLALIRYYSEVAKQSQHLYESEPTRVRVEGTQVRIEFRERYIFTLAPSLRPDEKEALEGMLTLGGMRYGFVGYELGEGRINVVDLEQRKILTITIADDRVAIYARNPSSADEAVKHVHRQIAEHIRPEVDIKVEKVLAV